MKIPGRPPSGGSCSKPRGSDFPFEVTPVEVLDGGPVPPAFWANVRPEGAPGFGETRNGIFHRASSGSRKALSLTFRVGPPGDVCKKVATKGLLQGHTGRPGCIKHFLLGGCLGSNKSVGGKPTAGRHRKLLVG